MAFRATLMGMNRGSPDDESGAGPLPHGDGVPRRQGADAGIDADTVAVQDPGTSTGTDNAGPPVAIVEPAPDSMAADDAKTRTRTGEVVRLAAIGAIVTAVVTAILSPSTFGAVKGWFVDDPSKDTSQTSREPVKFEAISSRDGSLTVHVPEAWGSGDGRWNLPFSHLIDAGSAVKGGIGAGLTTSNSIDDPNIYLGASSKAAERLQLPGREKQELEAYITELGRSLDYTTEGCTMDREGSHRQVGLHRPIQGVDQLPGLRGRAPLGRLLRQRVW